MRPVRWCPAVRSRHEYLSSTCYAPGDESPRSPSYGSQPDRWRSVRMALVPCFTRRRRNGERAESGRPRTVVTRVFGRRSGPRRRSRAVTGRVRGHSSDREAGGLPQGSVAGAEVRTIRKPAREGLRQERAGHATYKRPTPGTNLTFRVNRRKRGAGLPGWLRSRGSELRKRRTLERETFRGGDGGLRRRAWPTGVPVTRPEPSASLVWVVIFRW